MAISEWKKEELVRPKWSQNDGNFGSGAIILSLFPGYFPFLTNKLSQRYFYRFK
jgi:hypothetical protein